MPPQRKRDCSSGAIYMYIEALFRLFPSCISTKQSSLRAGPERSIELGFGSPNFYPPDPSLPPPPTNPTDPEIAQRISKALAPPPRSYPAVVRDSRRRGRAPQGQSSPRAPPHPPLAARRKLPARSSPEPSRASGHCSASSRHRAMQTMASTISKPRRRSAAA